MKRYLLLLVLFSFTISVYCQQITFQKTYGGIAYESANSVQQTTDGGYIITGLTHSFGAGGNDVYLIKTNAYGDTLWTKTFGAAGDDQGISVQQTTNGGYIIAGQTSSFGPWDFDIYLIKTDTNGDTLWTKTFGGSSDDTGYFVQQTNDGGYIVCGWISGSGFSLIKTDSNGNLFWAKSFGLVNFSGIATSVRQTTDGGYIITGVLGTFGLSDVSLLKTDANGNLLWSKVFGAGSDDAGLSVQQTTDGGYIIGGSTHSFGAGGMDVYLIKTDANGDSLWTRTFDESNYENGSTVQQTSDGGYIIGGYTNSFGAGDDDVYLIKTDANGYVLWSKRFYGTNNDRGISVQQTVDGGFIIGGYTTSFGAGYYDAYLIKTDSLGNSGCNQGNTATIVANPAAQVASPAIIVTSPAIIETTPPTIPGSAGIVTTLCITVGIQSAMINPKSGVSVSPNPFTSEFTVRSSEMINQIIIYNLIGEIVYQQELPSNKTSAELNLSFLLQGVYFLNAKSNGESYTKKIVKM